jgi:hypothetical protein
MISPSRPQPGANLSRRAIIGSSAATIAIKIVIMKCQALRKYNIQLDSGINARMHPPGLQGNRELPMCSLVVNHCHAGGDDLRQVYLIKFAIALPGLIAH